MSLLLLSNMTTLTSETTNPPKSQLSSLYNIWSQISPNYQFFMLLCLGFRHSKQIVSPDS
ncbi:hypothetical protein PRUPE_5G012100 [Prunus persica]|uniref:Uncharacterized protein n=1 Tax=Prunus persica TaxID=3760 RepID=A0A251P1W4_PRUPE|nr:hypothetical protein PRUPE_5G012100 [Prunus persica]